MSGPQSKTTPGYSLLRQQDADNSSTPICILPPGISRVPAVIPFANNTDPISLLQEQMVLLQEKIEFLMEENQKIVEENQQFKKKHNETDQSINEIKERLQGRTPDNGIDDNNSNSNCLDEDTFSIMMTSKFCSSGWLLGLVTFSCQIALVILILVGQAKVVNEASNFFGAPFYVDTSVRFGQFFAVILSVFTQSDVLTAIKHMIFFRNYAPIGNVTYWHKLLVDNSGVDDEESVNGLLVESDNKSMHMMHWFHRAIIPNLLKMLQGLLVLVVSFLIIVQSSDLIDLLKDFTALFFISEIDDYMFKIAAHGYLGKGLKARTVRVQSVSILEGQEQSDDSGNWKYWYYIKAGILGALIAIMIGLLGYIGQGQVSGRFFRMQYPKCDIPDRSDFTKINDGICDGGSFDTYHCGFDGGDCITFKIEFPGCNVTEPSWISNGICNGGQYNSEPCSFDGGDCDECNNLVADANLIGDGICHGGAYNSESCEFDGGDCNEFNSMYPSCDVDSPYLIINGICNGGEYNTELCGFDGGDCKRTRVFNMYGEGANSFLGTSTSLSTDGRWLAVGAPGHDNDQGAVYLYELVINESDGSEQWTQVGQRLMGEATGDRFGWSVSLTAHSSSMMVAVGAFHHDSRRGAVYLYKLEINEIGNTNIKQWSQIGQRLEGQDTNDHFGYSVSLAAHPTTGNMIVAVGAWHHDSLRGGAYFYELVTNESDDSEQWTQVGQRLTGEATDDWFGRSVSLTAHSSSMMVAVGAIGHDSYRGAVYLYKLEINESDTTTIKQWSQIGQRLEGGQDTYEYFGCSVSLAAHPTTGNMIVSVGADGHDSDRGAVFLYELVINESDDSEQWTQVGQRLTGEATGDYFGVSVSLTPHSSSMMVAVGAWAHDSGRGSVYMYELVRNKSNDYEEWQRVYQHLEGQDTGDQFGLSVSLADDGRTLAVGADYADSENAEESGSISVYTLG